jgi:hypothetical protein
MISIGAFAILPLTMPAVETVLAAPESVTRKEHLPLPQRSDVPPLLPFRDPFVPDQEAYTPAGSSTEEMLRGVNVVLPPNAGAQNQGALPGSGVGLTLRAVVIGTDAKALVESSGEVRLVSVGDRLGDAFVIAIQRDGLKLSNGLRLTIDGTQR